MIMRLHLVETLSDNTQRTVASSDANYFKADPTVEGSSAESLITVEPHYGMILKLHLVCYQVYHHGHQIIDFVGWRI